MARVALALAVALVLVLLVPARAAADAPGGDDATTEPVRYRPPVEAPISDDFRPPATRYGPGNRGIEYDTRRGDVVRAAAAGTVTFAGSVAGDRYVTVRHDDGLRTTYGPLARIAPGIAAGRTVVAGATLGAAGEHVLWTARLGAAYVDPGVLLAASGASRVRLVPIGRHRRAPAIDDD